MSWGSLGHQGRIFVQRTHCRPTRRVQQGPGLEPIRAYAGLHSAGESARRAELAAKWNAGGLKRKVIAVATTTGTGWISAAEADSLEYMFTATPPSSACGTRFPTQLALSSSTKRTPATPAGHCSRRSTRRYRALPSSAAQDRGVRREPGLLRREAPFLTPNNIITRTNGALFSSPTFQNTMRDFITDNQDPGSPGWLPIFDDGANVRFAARAENLGRPDAPWGKPRIVTCSTPPTRSPGWTPNCSRRTGLAARATWLRDVSSDMHWIPVVTFLQVAADMAVAVDVLRRPRPPLRQDAVNAGPRSYDRRTGHRKTERLRGLVTQDYQS